MLGSRELTARTNNVLRVSAEMQLPYSVTILITSQPLTTNSLSLSTCQRPYNSSHIVHNVVQAALASQYLTFAFI